jgi:cell division septal protein FtsQ
VFRKSRVGIWILLAMVFLAAGGTAVYLKETYTVETVYVEGNVHYTEEEIKAIVMSGPFGDNSLYLSLKYKNKGIEGIPFVDVVDVDILSPDTVKIIVYEKTLTGCVRYLDTYIYFDRDGYVVESSGLRTAGVPQIMGLRFDHMVTGEKLPVGNEEIFDSILSITQLLQKYELASDKIYFNKSGAVTLYFDQVKIALGNDSSTLEDKLMLLSQLLPNLKGKKGTLQMQTYDANSGKYVFKPET